MLRNRFTALLPLVFLIVGLVFLFVSEREFQRRSARNDAEFRHDLTEAGVARSEIAAIMAAHSKLEADAASYTQLSTFIIFIISTSMTIPLYARLAVPVKPADRLE